ncbi:MAG: PTS sugar transporter subunit IIB [Gemmatimonadota bacterium]
MSLALLRVDERLIHGQVTVGWGQRLQPDRYLVVDDHLSESAWERDILALGAPSGVPTEFLNVEETRARAAALLASEEVIVLLTKDLDHMLRLAREGLLAGTEVNLGGIHHADGREEVLPYLFLNEDDRERIALLEEEGVRIVARDLPNSPRRGAEELLR